MSERPDHSSPPVRRDAGYDWPRLIGDAAAGLERRFARCRVLSPSETARCVADALPPMLGRWLLATLRHRGWLRADARVPFDAVDALRDAEAWSPARQDLVRLAVFGLPGQGHTSDYKQREAIFEQRCAEIMRESRDMESLSFAASRALGHPAVAADPSLAGMLRAFITQRENELRARLLAQRPDLAKESKLAAAFDVSRRNRKREIEGHKHTLAKLRLRLEECVAHYYEPGAVSALHKIREMHEQQPGVCEPALLQQCEQAVAELRQKLRTFRSQLGELTRKGTAAAQTGEQERALWIARRLDAVRTILPAVITEEECEALRGSIMQGVEQFEHQQVARRILARERAIADEIRELATLVRQFHKASRETSPADEAYKQARAEFVKAVQIVRERDEEWIADLMLELDAMLEELGDTTGKSEAHIDQFLTNVRAALTTIRREILAIQSEQKARTTNKPSAGN